MLCTFQIHDSSLNAIIGDILAYASLYVLKKHANGVRSHHDDAIDFLDIAIINHPKNIFFRKVERNPKKNGITSIEGVEKTMLIGF
jgi:hypothetical protein